MNPTTEDIPSVSKPELIRKIGQTLEERRKVRGLTHEKISQTLKIRPSFLRAIESGDWKDLPGEVYARGFITRYAQHLGLNPIELLTPYFEFQNAEGKSTSESQHPAASSSFTKGGYIWGGVVLLVVVGLIKFVTTQQTPIKKNPTAATPVQSEMSISPVATPTATPMATPHQKLMTHRLEVFSPFPLWLSVKTESRSFEGFLPQGSTWSWKADGIFSIRLGHTQQLVLSFDGSPVALGENQKRVTLPSEN